MINNGMWTKVIVNPRAGRGRAERDWPGLSDKLTRGIGEFDSEMTGGPGHATEIARQAIKDRAGWVIAVGGDGVVNEVINGFFEDGELIDPLTSFSFINAGTGGDFSRTLATPADPDAAVKALAESKPRMIDAGRLEFTTHDGETASRHFINIASFGMSGEVDKMVNRMSAAKLLGGTAAFLYASTRVLLTYKNKTVRIKVDDQFDEEITVRMALIANGQYAGGGMHFAPEAKLDDGLFDVIVLGNVGMARSAVNMPKLYNGSYLKMKDVIFMKGKRITATSDREVLLDVDGEAPGRLPATFEILPGAIKLRA